ncbi:hypothetical protein IT407_04860 [Candidatus Uhrbacteria bacterium]|nr:hypothetical protein [Candidatus Uhrbacteria bacterium]
MHRTIESLPRAYYVCVTSDKLAVMNGLKPVPKRSAPTHWGYMDEFVPRKKNASPHIIQFQRDVFLRPTSDIEMEYVLGFKQEFDIDHEEVYVAFRATYIVESGSEAEEFNTERFPVTVFYEAVRDRWRISAGLTEYRSEKRIRRPQAWKELMDEFGFRKARGTMRPIKNAEGMPYVLSLMRLVAQHAGNSGRMRLE